MTITGSSAGSNSSSWTSKSRVRRPWQDGTWTIVELRDQRRHCRQQVPRLQHFEDQGFRSSHRPELACARDDDVVGGLEAVERPTGTIVSSSSCSFVGIRLAELNWTSTEEACRRDAAGFLGVFTSCCTDWEIPALATDALAERERQPDRVHAPSSATPANPNARDHGSGT